MISAVQKEMVGPLKYGMVADTHSPSIMNTNQQTIGYTFIEGLVTSGYSYARECGVWERQDLNGMMHTYLQDPDDTGDLNSWSYHLYDANDNLVFDQIFTVKS